MSVLSEGDYVTLYLSVLIDPEVQKRLTDPNHSVCPCCRVDDFFHSDDCRLYKEIIGPEEEQI